MKIIDTAISALLLFVMLVFMLTYLLALPPAIRAMILG